MTKVSCRFVYRFGQLWLRALLVQGPDGVARANSLLCTLLCPFWQKYCCLKGDRRRSRCTFKVCYVVYIFGGSVFFARWWSRSIQLLQKNWVDQFWCWAIHRWAGMLSWPPVIAWRSWYMAYTRQKQHVRNGVTSTLETKWPQIDKGHKWGSCRFRSPWAF